MIDEYILSHTEAEDPVLYELTRETHQKVLSPRMLSGHLQGKFLEMVCKMIKPMHILEIGTYTGYSAICMAKGLQNGGKLHTIELNDELCAMIKKYIKKAELEDKIELHIGNALEIVPKLRLEFDVVFIDGNKRQYCDYYDIVFDKVKKGGFILVDNVLWNGKVVEKVHGKDLQTQKIIEFNRRVQADRRVQNLLLPLRDGLMILQKKV